MPGGVVHHQRASALAPAALAIAWLALGCEPTVLIGSCADPSGAGGAAAAGGAGGAAAAGDAVFVPWSEGFEDGLCGYHTAGGFCYARHGASLEIVEAPKRRTGKFAAA